MLSIPCLTRNPSTTHCTEGSLATQYTSGTAMVSKGTIRVARTSESTMLLPFQRMREIANPIIELTMRPSTTIATVTTSEFVMNRAAGTRSKTPE